LDTQNNITEKSGKPAVLLIYCVISTVLLLYLGLFTAFPILDFAGIAAMGVFCSCYGVLLKKGYFALCIIPAGASLAAVIFMYGSQGAYGTEMLASVFNIAFPFLLAAFLNAGVERRASTGAVFALLSATGAVYISSLLLLVVYEFYSGINVDIIGRAIKDAAEFLGSLFHNPPDIASFMPDGGAELASSYDKFAAEYEAVFAELGKTVELTFKLTVPSIIAMCGMLCSAVIFILYKPFVKLAGLEKECFDGKKWVFDVTPLSAVLFEIVFIVYIILSFFSGNAVLNVAFMNIISVLTPPFAYLGLKALSGIVGAKLNSKVAGIAVIAAGFAVLLLLLGGSITTLAALFGVSFVTRSAIDKKTE